MVGSGGSTGESPSTDIPDYNQLLIEEDDNPTVLSNAETSSILIVADPENAGTIFVGGDDNVSNTTGTPLSPGSAINLPVDCSESPVWVFANSLGDIVSYIAVN